MSNLHFHIERTHTPGGKAVVVLVVSGFISAATEDIFQNALQQVRNCHCAAAFDFTSVAYINSTSFGELAACVRDLIESGQSSCLFSLRSDALFLFRQIGLEQMLPVRSSREEALAFFDHPDVDSESDLNNPEINNGSVRRTVRFSPALGHGRVMAVIDPSDPVLPLLWRMLRHRELPISSSAEAVEAELRRGPVELAVLDCAHPEYATLSRLLNPGRHGGAASVLHLGCGVSVPQPSDPATLAALRRLKDGNGISQIERRRREVAAELLLRGARLQLRSEAKACELGRLICQRMALAAGMNRNAADSFFFAVREAIDNACTHGNRLDSTRCVTVGFQVKPGRLELTVSDEGEGFAYESWLEAARLGPLAQAKKRVDAGEKGGLGITLMRCCCDDIEFLAPGNAVRLSKTLTNLPRLS